MKSQKNRIKELERRIETQTHNLSNFNRDYEKRLAAQERRYAVEIQTVKRTMQRAHSFLSWGFLRRLKYLFMCR